MARDVLTAGDMARRLGVPLHRVVYVLRSRSQLRPSGKVGNARVYSESDLQFVASELRRIDAERGITRAAVVDVPEDTVAAPVVEIAISSIATALQAHDLRSAREILKRLASEYGLTLTLAADLQAGRAVPHV